MDLRGGYHDLDRDVAVRRSGVIKDLAGLVNPPGLCVKQAKNSAQICDYACATNLAGCQTLAQRARLAADAHVAWLYDDKSAEEFFTLLLHNL